MDNKADIREAKKKMRALLTQSRKDMSDGDLHREDSAVASYTASLLRARSGTPATIAAYIPRRGEPGGGILLNALHTQAPTILLPISGPGGILEWSSYKGDSQLRPGRLSISEPTGERFPTAELLNCDMIFVPALAVTPEGVRLGKGGGYYDRALAELEEISGGNPPITAVLLYNGEIRDDLPVEEHDKPVDIIITPTGIRYLNDRARLGTTY
ncbi:5-formyltetrahydrofolate cyclo-ligase family protein [Corynebacterium occultum]|uniref:5-formyltetrahydrofolate cyclo-ligase n=1 Tax=Corynebacterium occultum TaxID=2675219 RepID=A0A6B8VUI0_9CORY|nr:5-formyltetrahydrofolate cyclo-ligase [Corynebacterium occultum]QGU06769.1 5-formyltetrahydrofolate cyclo-ligase family protein [Corynebacterium occultum]